MASDTWGVGYVLLDREDQILGDTVGYRDSRTSGIDKKVYEKISPEELYAENRNPKAGLRYHLPADGGEGEPSGTSGAGGGDTL